MTGRINRMRARMLASADPVALAEVEARSHGAAVGVEMMRAFGAAPEVSGTETVAVAPARGPVVKIDIPETYLAADGTVVTLSAGVHGRRPVRRRDVFDRMGDCLTSAQIAIGRDYRALTERHTSAGVRCSSLEASRSGGGSGGGWIDAVLTDRARLAALHRRIGDGSALAVRRLRPSSRGSRTSITDRRLVDMVCLEDATLSGVLRARGWAQRGAARAALRQALAAALERMVAPPQRSCMSPLDLSP